MHYLLRYLCFKCASLLDLKMKGSVSISKIDTSGEFLHMQVLIQSLGLTLLLQAKPL